VRVQVKVPLVGGSLEQSIGASVAGNIASVLRFATAWITENP